METNVKKYDRGKTFTEQEKEDLLDIAKKYLHIIENKKTDVITSKEKMHVWDMIASQFNSIATIEPRNGQQLKLLYEEMNCCSQFSHSFN
ncbi:hypothetical protein RI129_002659 [Pyrocoelia pectoralis]|uniref:Regulatory protein zeste n=1 Tax=Pyrocoelia pectoralis TaxID=417401 RepID=A0AAN7ZMD1_9COLE